MIVLGDTTSHGGKVITADASYTVDGIPIARIGDKVACPRCKRVSTIITSRFPSITMGGKPATFDQDTTDCGAILYSRNNGHAGRADRSGGGSSSGTSGSGNSLSSTQAAYLSQSQQPEGYKGRFILVNRETGQPIKGQTYEVRSESGKTVAGTTDDEGFTEWLDSKEEESLEFFLKDEKNK